MLGNDIAPDPAFDVVVIGGRSDIGSRTQFQSELDHSLHRVLHAGGAVGYRHCVDELPVHIDPRVLDVQAGDRGDVFPGEFSHHAGAGDSVATGIERRSGDDESRAQRPDEPQDLVDRSFLFDRVVVTTGHGPDDLTVVAEQLLKQEGGACGLLEHSGKHPAGLLTAHAGEELVDVIHNSVHVMPFWL